MAIGTRLPVYLVAAFAITWLAWWTLAAAIPATGTPFDNGLHGTLYILGGFGPTIAAFVAVALTPSEGAFREYLARLTRWRVNPLWYVAVLAVPPLLAFGKEAVSLIGAPSGIHFSPLKPLLAGFTLFPAMIVGGGLEELGWRGVAQPAMESRTNRLYATVAVGVIWVVWHIPLFFIHGTAQFGDAFGLFAIDVLANAFLLAWVYGGTNSILLCILCHAASNTATAMGLSAPDETQNGAWAGAAVKLLVGFVLLMTVMKKAREINA
jgi:uncharacterized protein